MVIRKKYIWHHCICRFCIINGNTCKYMQMQIGTCACTVYSTRNHGVATHTQTDLEWGSQPTVSLEKVSTLVYCHQGTVDAAVEG